MNLRGFGLEKRFKQKWGISTGGVHRIFVEAVKTENSRISHQLRGAFEVYFKNKLYREYLKEGKENIKSFGLGFDPYHQYYTLPKDIRYPPLLANINLDTLLRSTKKIAKVFNSTGSGEL